MAREWALRTSGSGIEGTRELYMWEVIRLTEGRGGDGGKRDAIIGGGECIRRRRGGRRMSSTRRRVY